MKLIKIFCLLMCLLSVASEINAQYIFRDNDSGLNSSLKNPVKIGDYYFENFSYKKAAKSYQQALKKQDDNTIRLKIAECYRKLNDPDNAVNWYAQVIRDESIIQPIHVLHYAQALSSIGDYEVSKKYFQQYDELSADKMAGSKLLGLDNIEQFYETGSSFKIEHLEINSNKADFSPAFYGDGIVFVSNRGGANTHSTTFNWNESAFLDLYFTMPNSTESGTDFKEPTKFSSNINAKLHEGPVVFYDDDQKMIFSRSNFYKGKTGRSSDGINKIQMFTASKKGNGWSNIKPVSFNDREYSVGHPTVSKDGTKLYFSSDMPGGYGGSDIYVSFISGEEWGFPENLGPAINTSGEEMFPYIGEDDLLFFASNGREGLGGLDVYAVDLEVGTDPVNLGDPINSPKDDFGFIIKDNFSEGYFTSSRDGGKGDDDIYHFTGFEIPDYANQREEVFVEKEEESPFESDIDDYSDDDLVFDPKPDRRIEQDPYADPYSNPLERESNSNTGNGYERDNYNDPFKRDPLSDAPYVDITLVENYNSSNQVLLSTASTIYEFKQVNGVYYLLNGTDQIPLEDFNFNGRNGLNKVQVNLEMSGTSVERAPLYDYLQKSGVMIRKTVLINNIYYDFDQHFIRNDAREELDKIIILMDENPEIYLELAAFTDARGSNQYNIDLSKRRALAAFDYVTSRGVSKYRVITGHLGESQLLNDCQDGVNCPENDHQVNRRTEFIIKF